MKNNMMNDEIIILLLLKDAEIIEKNILIFPMKEKISNTHPTNLEC
jgi:hypothetical protein